jgi:DNA-binding CsgD family transcriptional regulator
MASGLGRPRAHSDRQIRERREKISILLARGYSQFDIIDELKISRMTYNRDMHSINEMNNKGLFEMAKTAFATMYMNVNDGYNALLYQCWKTYKNEDNNPEITPAIRMAALKLAAEIYDKKLNMFQNGPATMELKRLHDKVDELRRGALSDDNIFTQRYPRKDPNLNMDDLGKP